MGEIGGVVEWRLTAIVKSIERDLVLEEDVDNDILSIVAGHVKRGAAIGIDSIRLQGQHNTCIYMYMYI